MPHSTGQGAFEAQDAGDKANLLTDIKPIGKPAVVRYFSERADKRHCFLVVVPIVNSASVELISLGLMAKPSGLG